MCWQWPVLLWKLSPASAASHGSSLPCSDLFIIMQLDELSQPTAFKPERNQLLKKIKDENDRSIISHSQNTHVLEVPPAWHHQEVSTFQHSSKGQPLLSSSTAAKALRRDDVSEPANPQLNSLWGMRELRELRSEGCGDVPGRSWGRTSAGFSGNSKGGIEGSCWICSILKWLLSQMQTARSKPKICLRQIRKCAEQALSASLSLGEPTTASRPRGIKTRDESDSPWTTASLCSASSTAPSHQWRR